MSGAGNSAHVRIILADYGSVDIAGKINMIGGGVMVTGFMGATTAPFAVVAVVNFDPKYAGDAPAMELQLEHEDGSLVPLPGVVNDLAEPQYVRVGDSEQLKPVIINGIHVPTEKMRIRKQLVLHFANGLPLTPGTLYRWRVKIDGQQRDAWTEQMFVPTAGAGPVIG